MGNEENGGSESLVSVVMPVHNAIVTLRSSVASVQGQTHGNLELILVNDGSTDGSGELCEELSSSDPRIRVIHQDNGGVGSARNRGLYEAKGTFIQFMDSDDEIDPECLSLSVVAAQASQADLVIYGMEFVGTIDGIESSWLRKSLPEAIIRSEEFRDVFLDMFAMNYLTSVCNKLLRVEVLSANSIVFNPRMPILEDFEFVLRALMSAQTVVLMPQDLYKYRREIGTTSLSRRRDSDYLSNFKALNDTLFSLGERLRFDNAESDRMYGIAFRHHLLGLEHLFELQLSWGERWHRFLIYAGDPEVVGLARRVRGVRMWVRVSSRLVRQGSFRRLYLMFFILVRLRRLKASLDRKVGLWRLFRNTIHGELRRVR